MNILDISMSINDPEKVITIDLTIRLENKNKP